MAASTADVKRFVSLTREKRQLESQLREIEKQLDALNEPITESMIEAGMQSMKIDGMTVYIGSRLGVGVADGADKQELVDELRRHGLERCVGLNYQSLSSAVREATDEQSGEINLSPKLLKLLKITDIRKLAARSA